MVACFCFAVFFHSCCWIGALYTTTTSALCERLLFVVRLRFALQAGCGRCHKQYRCDTKTAVALRRPPPIYSRSKFLGCLFLVLDEGKTSLTHLLLEGFENECFFVPAYAFDCKQVVDDSASRKVKKSTVYEAVDLEPSYSLKA